MFRMHIGLSQPAEYEIKIQGRVKDCPADWFMGQARVEYTHTGSDTVTCITGTVADQAALHGLLAHIRDLGLALLYVECLTAHERVYPPE